MEINFQVYLLKFHFYENNYNNLNNTNEIQILNRDDKSHLFWQSKSHLNLRYFVY